MLRFYNTKNSNAHVRNKALKSLIYYILVICKNERENYKKKKKIFCYHKNVLGDP